MLLDRLHQAERVLYMLTKNLVLETIFLQAKLPDERRYLRWVSVEYRVVGVVLAAHVRAEPVFEQVCGAQVLLACSVDFALGLADRAPCVLAHEELAHLLLVLL